MSEIQQEERGRLDATLSKLCRYYLDCLSNEDLGGVSEFASAKSSLLKYIELPALPMAEDTNSDLFGSDDARQLLGRVARDRGRQTILLGYPVRLKLERSRGSGREVLKVEPLLLVPLQEAAGRHDKPMLADDVPQINFRALRSLSNTGESGLMDEALQLAEDLGLEKTVGVTQDLYELALRLREVRPHWDWRESPDARALSDGTRLSDLKDQGIYNRAILMAVDRSPYTRGLEYELGALQSVGKARSRETALGAWLTTHTIDSPPADQRTLLEVLPLNSEQRQAVRQALENALTVVTGPPGTGKSQVVTSILVNAAWQGKTVLFVSKNNKAVDVVETRVNGIGPRPVLLRLGANQYQSQLADYLVSLLAASATPDDQQRYQECEAEHEKLVERSAAIDTEIQDLVQLRNEVDAIEQHVEHIRQDVGEEFFLRFRSIDCQVLRHGANHLQGAIEKSSRAKQPALTRMCWPFLRAKRLRRLAEAAEAFRNASQDIGLPLPDTPIAEPTVDRWVQYSGRLTLRLAQLTEAHEYFAKLTRLTEARSLEELGGLRVGLTADLANNSEALWKAWLRLQPARMTPNQRKLLGDYSALLQMIVSANAQSRGLGRDVYRRYYELFPKIAAILSCWAVTSLSARGRVPFDPKFFDLLVVDEASQCDIASALPLLYRARRVVVIGDPMQLRHISTLSKQQDQRLLSKHGLLEEYPGWSYSTRSLFDLASSLCRSEDIVELRDHHRSHADIIGFSNEEFYAGRLRVATPYDRLRIPSGGEPAVRWIHVQGTTVRPASGGAVSEEEAQQVVAAVRSLLSQGYRGSVGVVSPFRAQANRIRDLVHQDDVLSSRIAALDFLADTVHKFQGDERDVMIFSPAVAPGISDGALRFLRSNANLFNVAITRARAALIVVGDRSAARNCGIDYLSRFATYVEQVCTMQTVDEELELHDCGHEYPAVARPELVSDWERLFYRAIYLAGVRPIPQYQVEQYLLDFAVVIGDKRLNIEIDGERYHRNWDGELCRKDQIRSQRLIELGWDVVRFWVYEVRDDMDGCVARVLQWTTSA